MPVRLAAALACAGLPVSAAAVEGFALGFEPTPWEQHFDHVELQGTVPAWVNGTFFRNGPGQWYVNGDNVNWFMGLSYIVAFKFKDGKVQYTSRFMETDDYYLACKAAGSCKKKLPTKVTGPSCPVTFTQVDGSYLATTEFSASSSFDPDTLKLAESPFKFGPDSLGAMKKSPSHDVMLADGVRLHHFAEDSQNIVYEIAAGSRVRKQCAATPEDKTDKGSRYQHQALGTAEWYVMFEGPCFGGFGSWDWEPDLGTRVRLVNRLTGVTQDYWTTTNYFTVHQANAYVDGDDLVADLVASDVGCEKLTVNFKLGTLRDPTAHAMNWSHTEQAFRLRLPLKQPNATVTPQLISPMMGVEFPVMSPNVLGLKHTHAYMSQLTTAESPWYDAAVKMNMQTGETKVVSKPGFYVGEPVYAPSPGEGLADDNGVAFAVALDTANKASVLWVIDAKTWTLSASLPLPEMLPFQYHGRYYDHTLN